MITRIYVIVYDFSLLILRLNGGDCDNRNDIIHTATAGEIVDRVLKALADGSDCFRTGEALHHLIADVACL